MNQIDKEVELTLTIMRAQRDAEYRNLVSLRKQIAKSTEAVNNREANLNKLEELIATQQSKVPTKSCQDNSQ